VASRRLRCALRVAGTRLDRKAPRWRKQVRRLTRSLGQARDLDVQIACVEGFSRRARPQWRPDLGRLGEELRRRRAETQRQVLRVLEQIRSCKVLNQVRDRARHAGRRAETDSGAPADDARMQGERAILTALNEFLAFAPFVARPQCKAELHQMRIAAKRLRYTMEVFEPAFGRCLGPYIAAAQRSQQLLGELHDCDVWLAQLPELPAAWKAPRRAAGAGIRAFARDRARERRRLYREFAKTWRRWRLHRTWARLAYMLCAGAPAPRRAARPARAGPARTPLSGRSPAGGRQP
jgi:CHAD domain-containing protein